MKARKLIYLLGFLLTLNPTISAGEGAISKRAETKKAEAEPENKFYWLSNLYDDVLCDYSIAYGKDNLIRMGALLIVTGAMANSGFDHSFHKFYQKNIRSDATDDFFKPFEKIGVYNYMPVYIGSIFLGHALDKYPVGNTIYEWGYRTFRAMLIVSPQITLLRSTLGGGGPHGREEDLGSSRSLCDQKHHNSTIYESSKWRLFHHGRSSCSGHTFNGALPFLTAAMMSETPIYRYGFYILSALPGAARINDDKHYLSQVLLGWGLAFLAVKAVDDSEAAREETVRMSAYPSKNGMVVQLGVKF